jgi:hypothetical protein
MTRSFSPNFLLVSRLLLVATFYGSLALAQAGSSPTGNYDHLGRPMWVVTPKTEAIEDVSDPERAAIRHARSRMFDVPGATPLVSHDLSDKSSPSGGGFDSFVTRDPIPTGISDVVVVATASSFQPFLSTDKSMVYSELTTTPFEVIKDSKSLIAPGKDFIILQRGGTLRLASGKVVNAVPYGGSNPIRLGTRYLLFLQYHPQERAFTVLRAWDLSDTKPREMDDDGHPYVGRLNSLENELNSEAELKQRVKAQ